MNNMSLFNKIINKLFYYIDEETDALRPCFKWYKTPCHAGFVFSLGGYFDNHIKMRINLFFGQLYITTPFKINVPTYEIGCSNYRQYGFSFYNDEGSEHCLFIYCGKKTKIIDMPWHLEHYRTTYFTTSGKPFFNDYSYPDWIRKMFPNDRLHIWDLIMEYTDKNESRFKQVFDYKYVLNSGEVQERKAKVSIEEMEWRRNWWMWSKVGSSTKKYIEIEFDGEVGEKSGTWKGGVVAMSFEMNEGETIEETFRRFEREKKL